MTSQTLATDLSTIIQETKRKNPELRSAAEQSLQDLKALPSTSEAQLAADLRRRPHFINPFLGACRGRQPKAVLPAISCLQRLVVSSGIPSERLKDVLEAFQECVGSGLDVQLKILQSLPSLLQTHGSILEGELQAQILQLCTVLQQVKNTAVSSTASATLQQTISALYEKIDLEDDNKDDIAPIEGVLVDNQNVPVRPAAFDAYRVLKDVCLMIEGHKTIFMINASITSAFGLELIESLLLNHPGIFETHVEQGDILLGHVMPLINRCLSERHSFSVTVRAIRVLCILMREHLTTVHSECEISFGLLNHVIETESQQPWRRALCMEAFRLLYSNLDLFVKVYSTFDLGQNRRNTIQDNLSLFVRVASEKPSAIGMGNQSTFPASHPSTSGTQEQAVLEAEAAAGMIGSDFGVSEKDASGISAQWSSMKVPCLDQLDKNDGPPIPETYIYSLILICINQLSDLLARIILPIAMHQTKSSKRTRNLDVNINEDSTQQTERPTSSNLNEQSRQSSTHSHHSRSIPTNPLDLKDNPARSSAEVVASLTDTCWPAVLATASTFFNAALDADFYRSLVRSFQKFTQVAGILRLPTPRDALLTALAKNAVPPNLLSGDSITSPSSGTASPGANNWIRNLPGPSLEALSSITGADASNKYRSVSTEAQAPMLTQRNLMCLRALVHLAIALGPILDNAWSIILDTIQKSYVILSASRNVVMAQDYKITQTQSESTSSQSALSSEIAAVEAAQSRLFNSSNDYPKESFQTLLSALCDLIQTRWMPQAKDTPPLSPPTLAAPPVLQKRTPSVSGLVTSAAIQPEYIHFAITKIGETAKANLSRLAQHPDEGWDSLVDKLNKVSTSTTTEEKARRMAADVIARLSTEACISTTALNEKTRADVQDRCFKALKQEIDDMPRSIPDALSTVDLDVHLSALESLRSILEHCGESIITGWETIFNVTDSVFDHATLTSPGKEAIDPIMPNVARPLSAKLARSSFASIQLICSDFIDNLPKRSFPLLVAILSRFGRQTVDLNISLTVVTLFWNVSDYLRKQTDRFDVVDTSDVLASNAASGTVAAIWMNLQQQLAELVLDHRADVRNGSIHIIYRTLDSCGSQLTSGALDKYLHTVILQAMEIDSRRQLDMSLEETAEDLIKAYTNTSRIIVEGFTKFCTSNLAEIMRLQAFEQLWHLILEKFAIYRDAESYQLDHIIFTTLTQILRTKSEDRQLSQNAVDETASLWARAIPKSRNSSDDTQAQEKALVSYVQCIQEIYQTVGSRIQAKQIEIVIERLYECLSAARTPPYTSDVDQMTTLQEEILHSLALLQSNSHEAMTRVLEQLARFAYFPCMQIEKPGNSKRLTFIAFAKQTMDMTAKIVIENGSNHDLFHTDWPLSVLKSVIQIVCNKHKLQSQGKEPVLWKKAISTVLSILPTIMVGLQQTPLSAKQHVSIWDQVVLFGAAVQNGNLEGDIADDVLIDDETVELRYLESYRRIVTGSLDNDANLRAVRMQYVRSLYECSIIHASPFDDLDDSSDIFSPKALEDITGIRLGRTFDPPFNPRIRICYSCFDELFSLATADRLSNGDDDEKESTIRIKALLAELALPTIIVRCSMPLKRYIADQPLRGRMPTPMSQRLELLHIMRRIEDSQPHSKGNHGDGQGLLTSNVSEVLKRLAPLISRARELTGSDRELANAMGNVVAVALPL